MFNIDKYDAIIGTLFMRQFGILLNLKNNVLRFEEGDLCLPALSLEEDRVEQAWRSASCVSSHAEAE